MKTWEWIDPGEFWLIEEELGEYLLQSLKKFFAQWLQCLVRDKRRRVKCVGGKEEGIKEKKDQWIIAESTNTDIPGTTVMNYGSVWRWVYRIQLELYNVRLFRWKKKHYRCRKAKKLYFWGANCFRSLLGELESIGDMIFYWIWFRILIVCNNSPFILS